MSTDRQTATVRVSGEAEPTVSDDPKTEDQTPSVNPAPVTTTAGLTDLQTDYFLAAWPDPETDQEPIGVPYAPAAESAAPIEPYVPEAVPAEWVAPSAGAVENDWNPPSVAPVDEVWSAPAPAAVEVLDPSSDETGPGIVPAAMAAEAVAGPVTGKKAKQEQHAKQAKQQRKEKKEKPAKPAKQEKAPKPAKQEKDPYRPRFAVAPAPVRIASLITWAVAITLIGGAAATLSVVMSGTDTVNGVVLPVLALWFIAAAQAAVAILWLLAGAGLARGDRAWWKITIALTFLLVPLLPVALAMWILLSVRGTRDWVV